MSPVGLGLVGFAVQLPNQREEPNQQDKQTE
jgi:hypothetical protein